MTIRELMKKERWNMNTLSEALEITRPTLYKWIAQKEIPKLIYKERMAHLLSVEIEELEKILRGK